MYGPSCTRRPSAGLVVLPRVAVLDNLRECSVVSRLLHDAGLNPLYRDVLAHYGVTGTAVAKFAIQIEKEKVESGVAHAQKTPLKGKKFEES